jgi:hypothetical protein
MSSIIFWVLFMFAVPVFGQESSDLTGSLTEAILDLTTTPKRNLQWRPCGEKLSIQKQREFAGEIAKEVVRIMGDDLDPWWMLAQLMQESGLNPCQISGSHVGAFRKVYGRSPSKRDILMLLKNPSKIEGLGLSRMVDGGIAQFRWPGRFAKMMGLSDPEEVLNLNSSLTAFGKALRFYRSQCKGEVFNGAYAAKNGKIVRYNFPCSDVYWVMHNVGGVGFRYSYYAGVRSRYKIIEKRRENFMKAGD